MGALDNSRLDYEILWDYDNPAESEARFRELLPGLKTDSLNKSRYLELLTQIARAEGLQEKFDEAHRTLDQVEEALRIDSNLRRAKIRYLLERGRAFNSSGKAEESRQFFLDAWELAKRSDEDFLAVDAAHMMAIIEPTANQQDWNFKALDLAQKFDDPKAKKWVAILFNNIGWTYFKMKRYEAALDALQKALEHRIKKRRTP